MDRFEPLSAMAALEIAAVSVKGTLRAHNSDHYLAIKLTRGLETVVSSLADADRPPTFEERAYAMLVADGIGRRGEGARASRVVLSAIAHLTIQHGKWHLRVDTNTAPAIKQQIQLLYRLANRVLRQASRNVPGSGLTTSLTLVEVAGGDLFFASVGDSTAFIFRAGDLIRLTSANLDPLVTQAIGSRLADADVEIRHTQLLPEDRLLLCTNGLTDVVSDAEIADGLTLRRRPADDCQQLVNLAVLRGSHDDITAMVGDFRLAGAGHG